jgi:hypothetical protein
VLTETLLFLLQHHLSQLLADLGDHRLDLFLHGSLWKLDGQRERGNENGHTRPFLGFRAEVSVLVDERKRPGTMGVLGSTSFPLPEVLAR